MGTGIHTQRLGPLVIIRDGPGHDPLSVQNGHGLRSVQCSHQFIIPEIGHPGNNPGIAGSAAIL